MENTEPLNLARIQARMSELKEWGLDRNAIVKEFTFKDFKESMIFVNNVAELAEKMSHHPSLLVEYDKVRLTVTTHDAHGLTDKDFEIAKEIDKL